MRKEGTIVSKESGIIIAFVSLFLAVISVLVGVSMVTSGVIGANQSTTIARVYVWNTEPNLYSVTMTPAAVDLTPGNTTQVNCTGYVWDYNGFADVNVTEAILYHSTVVSTDADDNNNHYTLTGANCSCNQTGSSDTNATCICPFDVWYYATNGTWTCNMTISDKGGNATERIYNFNSSNEGTGVINTVVGINVPAELDYGNLSVTETSTEKVANISNFGNVPINISVRGYGGTDSTAQHNLSMICAYGNMTMEKEKWSLVSGTAYASMIALTNESVSLNWTLPVRTNDDGYGMDTNSTYWRLEVPLTVGGNCNGTLEFTANTE